MKNEPQFDHHPPDPASNGIGAVADIYVIKNSDPWEKSIPSEEFRRIASSDQFSPEIRQVFQEILKKASE